MTEGYQGISQWQNLECLCPIWRRGVVFVTTAQLHSTKPELRLCAGSNPVCGM